MKKAVSLVWRSLVVACVLVSCCLFAATAQAHLLNMTRVTVNIDEQGAVTASIDVDLTKEAGGGAAYYALSQVSTPLTNDAFRPLVERIEAATVFKLGERVVPVQVTHVALPEAPEADFTSGLAWPMTRFTLRGKLPVDFTTQSLQVMFADSFKFEEPVAVNITYSSDQISLSRWLVRNQYSPDFSFNRSAPSSKVNAESVATWLSYLQQGALHVVPNGWDHALFVLGLLLGVSSLRQLILLITRFYPGTYTDAGDGNLWRGGSQCAGDRAAYCAVDCVDWCRECVA